MFVEGFEEEDCRGECQPPVFQDMSMTCPNLFQSLGRFESRSDVLSVLSEELAGLEVSQTVLEFLGSS